MKYTASYLINTHMHIEKKNIPAFILNPVAAGGYSNILMNKLEMMFRHDNLLYEKILTQKEGAGNDIAQQLIDAGYCKIIAVGGDGTLHQVANGILLQKKVNPSNVTLGLVPAGTGNDYARYWNLPRKAENLFGMLKNNKTVMHDVVKVCFTERKTEAYLISMGGCGFDADVAIRAHNEKRKGKGGKLVYLRCLVKSVLKYKPMQMTLIADKQNIRNKIFSVAIGNNHSNGGGIKQCPGATMTDGLLNVTVIGDISLFQILLNLKGLFSGSFTKHKKVTTLTGKNFIISDAPYTTIELDGEPYFAPPAKFILEPQKLKLIVP